MKSIVLFLLVFIPFISSAQTLQYGLRAGGNIFPVVTTDSQFDNTLRPGWNAGVFGSYRVSEFFSLRAEGYYSLKVKTYTTSETASLRPLLMLMGLGPEILGPLGESFNLDVYRQNYVRSNMHFIEIPLMACFDILPFLKIELGAYGAYLFAARNYEVYSENIPLLEATTFFDESPEFNFLVNLLFPAAEGPVRSFNSDRSRYSALDAGVIGGLSYKAANDVWFHFRYSRGFVDFRGRNEKKFHSNFQVLVSYPLNNLVVSLKRNNNG